MDTRRSFYLSCKQDDFSWKQDDFAQPFDPADIPYITSANDNVPTKLMLSARCRALLHRLITSHSFNRSGR